MQRFLRSQIKTCHYSQRFFFSKVVGVPKENHDGERRVAISPEGVKKLTKLGYQVKIEKDCGKDSDFPDSMYQNNGADVCDNVFDSDIILKVRPPSNKDVKQMKKDQVLFSFLYPQ